MMPDGKSWFMPALLMICALTLWAMMHVATRHAVIELGYEISKEQEIRDQLASSNKALRIEISTLKSPKRLEMIAEKELGLVKPGPEQVVYLWSRE